MRQDPAIDLFDPLTLLRHCHALGAGGMQCGLGVLQGNALSQLRDFAEQNQLYIEAIVSLPKNQADLSRFAEEMRAAKAAGALAVRTTILSGRRYELFDDVQSYQTQVAAGRARLEMAAPVADQVQLPLAVENHKDLRNAELIQLLEAISSEHVGVCLDTGNSLALLEDPLQTIRDLAPWAHSVHLKDQSLAMYEAGFLLGDVPLGQGSLDLPEMVRIIRQAKSAARFSLELITRDPLQVPCLTDRYWSTFPELPARELARTLRYTGEHTSPNGQQISVLTKEEQLSREDANIRESLLYATEKLRI